MKVTLDTCCDVQEVEKMKRNMCIEKEKEN